ncbi:hypothetical protein LCGC14_2016530 [marine sediment metagenome]|uniref:Uncharacterized protein n=1 Tax=marine sediment metagenome TaxID=412755 RepID=A0A0F9EYW2_9ZZZZ
MPSLGEVVQDLGSGGMSMTWIFIWALIVGISLIFICFLGWLLFFKVRWNLKVEIKLPRSDGRIINGEWGKGFYDAKRGSVYIKRPGRGSRKVAMKIFDVKRYLQGTDLLTVIQVGPEEFRPVLNHSYSEHLVNLIDKSKPVLSEDGKPVLDEKGNPLYKTVQMKDSIMNIQTETGKNKAWKAAFEDAATNAYTMKSIFRQYQTPIAIGIVVICCFIGFAVLWTKLSSVCS